MAVPLVFACTVETVPCPPANQVWVPVVETLDWVALGVTATEMLYVFTWGAGAVLSMWAIGYAVGCAIAAIGKA